MLRLSWERGLTALLFFVEKAQEVAQQINESGGSAIAVPGDMLDDKYIDELVKKAAEFGNGKIHIIVNNAGFTWDGVIHKVCRCFCSTIPYSPDHTELLD